MRTLVVDRRDADRPTEWFTAIEEGHCIIVYQAEYDPTEWTRLCVRQADRILLLLAAAARPEAEPPALAVMPTAARGEQIEAVFIHDYTVTSGLNVTDSLARYKAGFHYHLRSKRQSDMERLARLVSGRAIGLVFSGGGARGFAHIGVMRAFKAAGIPFDLVGGTSMGSMIAAAALEWDEAETMDHLKRAFVITNPLSDYTLPLVAIVRGRKVSRLLREHFGEALIEECWRPFFCTSLNLTAGSAKVHRAGPLWRALRASIAIPGVLPPVIENSHRRGRDEQSAG